MYSKAWEGNPPSHPWLSQSAPEQSTNYYSDKIGGGRVLVAIAQWASSAPTVEKVQQEPQWPWFLTSVTTPSYLQSTGRRSEASTVASYSVDFYLAKDYLTAAAHFSWGAFKL